MKRPKVVNYRDILKQQQDELLIQKAAKKYSPSVRRKEEYIDSKLVQSINKKGKMKLGKYLDMAFQIKKHFKDLHELTENFYQHKLIYFEESIDDELAEKFLRGIFYTDYQSSETLQLAYQLYQTQRKTLSQEGLRLNFILTESPSRLFPSYIHRIRTQEDYEEETGAEADEDIEAEDYNNSPNNNSNQINYKYFQSFGFVNPETTIKELEELGYSVDLPGYINNPLDNFNYFEFVKYLSEKAIEAVQLNKKYMSEFRRVNSLKSEIVNTYRISGVSFNQGERINIKAERLKKRGLKHSKNSYLDKMEKFGVMLKRVLKILEAKFNGVRFDAFADTVEIVMSVVDTKVDSSSKGSLIIDSVPLSDMLEEGSFGKRVIVYLNNMFVEEELVEFLTGFYLKGLTQKQMMMNKAKAGALI